MIQPPPRDCAGPASRRAAPPPSDSALCAGSVLEVIAGMLLGAKSRCSALDAPPTPTPAAAHSVAAAISDSVVFGPPRKEEKIHFPVVVPSPILPESAAPLRSRSWPRRDQTGKAEGLCLRVSGQEVLQVQDTCCHLPQALLFCLA